MREMPARSKTRPVNCTQVSPGNIKRQKPVCTLWMHWLGTFCQSEIFQSAASIAYCTSQQWNPAMSQRNIHSIYFPKSGQYRTTIWTTVWPKLTTQSTVLNLHSTINKIMQMQFKFSKRTCFILYKRWCGKNRNERITRFDYWGAEEHISFTKHKHRNMGKCIYKKTFI